MVEQRITNKINDSTIETDEAKKLENKTAVKKHEPPTKKISNYAYLKKQIWYWITLLLSIGTGIVALVAPYNVYPIVYFRLALGVVFVVFLPGFAFIKALYPQERSTPNNDESLHPIERLALSMGSSVILTALAGLALNFTPWGIRIAPVVLSQVSLTAILATVALFREFPTQHA